MTGYRFVDGENVNKVLANVLTDDHLDYEYIGDDLRETYPSWINQVDKNFKSIEKEFYVIDENDIDKELEDIKDIKRKFVIVDMRILPRLQRILKCSRNSLARKDKVCKFWRQYYFDTKTSR